MRRPIRILPKDLAEKIAAGEVVERPASVIKELVENALDAGATRVRVDLEDGGRKRMAILDDGCGIPAAELETALERHATSKISALDDLWGLHTMGFRGEALPSIAAISRFTIESRFARTDGGPADGRRLYLEGGVLTRDTPLDPTSPLAATPCGTLVTVEDLFFNVPARLKFMKSRSAEASQIRELLERLALCNPNVAFTLLSDGRKSLSLERATPEGRFTQILDSEADASASLEGIESNFETISVRGWLDRDTRASNSRQIYLAVNGRMVRDKLLQQAVLVALRPRMMEGEYPRVFLAVTVDPADVDVNVHPAKSEVRFRRARDVFQVVHGALDRIAREPTKPYYASKLPGSAGSTSVDAAATTTTATAPSYAAARPESPELARPSGPIEQVSPLFPKDRVSFRTKSAVAVNIGGLTAAFGDLMAEETAEPAASVSGDDRTQTAVRTPGFSHLQYIGQVKNTYLLFQDNDGLVVVDQHAAHERVNYEDLKAELFSTGLKPQPLLISAVVKCKADDIALALDHAETLARLGFEYEAFGDSCLLLRACPGALAQERAIELFRALLEELRESDASALGASDTPSSLARLSPKLERMLATSACHASVRAGQALSPKEARDLALKMDTTESSLNCPHGRPASVKLTFSQLEALFKR